MPLARVVTILALLALAVSPGLAAPNIYIAEQAVREGDVETLQQQIDAGLEVDQPLVNYRTLLGVAVDEKQYGPARLLVAAGAVVASTNPWDYSSPLNVAAQLGDATMTAILLGTAHPLSPQHLNLALDYTTRYGQPGRHKVADLLINAGAEYGLEEAAALGRTADLEKFFEESPERIRESTPLFHAAMAAEPAAVEWLLDHGAPVNARWKYLGTPLRVVATNTESPADVETARVLLEHGADINGGFEDDDMPPLHLAALRENEDLALFLLEQGAVYQWEKPDRTSLMDTATYNGNKRLTHALLQRGMKLNFHNAAAAGSIDLMRLMLLADPEVLNATQIPGGTPLHWAVVNNQVEAAAFLLDQGADPNVEWFWQGKPAGHVRTATMARVFVERGLCGDPLFRMDTSVQMEIAEQLLAQGADTEVLNASSNTPLIAAMLQHQFDYARALVEHGADAHYIGGMGHSGFSLAVDFRHVPLLKLMMAHGADINSTRYGGGTLLHRHTGHGSLELVQLLLELGADPQIMDERHNTPLDNAIACGRSEISRLLAKHGANPADTWEMRNALIKAVEEENITRVRRLLDEGANPNGVVMWDMPLHKAAMNGNIPLIRMLIAAGADPNRRQPVGWTPLSTVARRPPENSREVVDALVRNGAIYTIHDAIIFEDNLFVQSALARDPDLVHQRSAYGEMPLHTAAAKGNVDVMKLLVEHGADLNALSHFWDSPMSVMDVAVRPEGSEAVDYLRSLGVEYNIFHAIMENNRAELDQMLRADPSLLQVEDAHWDFPLKMAAGVANPATVRLLLEHGAEPNQASSRYRTTPLHAAVMERSIENAEVLLEYGADPNQKDCFCRSPLDHVNAQEEPELHGLLSQAARSRVLPADADPHALDSNGNTPLIQAMLARNFVAALDQLERGADPDYIGGMNHSAFTLALDYGIEPLVELMLRHGVDINAREYHGGTLLHHYAGGGREDAVRLLIDKGADVQVLDERGRTPWHVARDAGYGRIMQILDETGAHATSRGPVRTGLLQAIRNGNAATVRRLLDEGASPDASLYRTTPLHVAAAENQLLIARLLLARGADPNARDYLEQTPLHVAVRYNRQKVVDLLLEANADPNLRDSAGRSVKDYINQETQPWLMGRMDQLQSK